MFIDTFFMFISFYLSILSIKFALSPPTSTTVCLTTGGNLCQIYVE